MKACYFGELLFWVPILKQPSKNCFLLEPFACTFMAEWHLSAHNHRSETKDCRRLPVNSWRVQQQLLNDYECLYQSFYYILKMSKPQSLGAPTQFLRIHQFSLCDRTWSRLKISHFREILDSYSTSSFLMRRGDENWRVDCCGDSPCVPPRLLEVCVKS